MIKAILWDIDGVIIQHSEYFSSKLSEENYHDPAGILNEFRDTGLNQKCDQGMLDPLTEIRPFLHRMGWMGTSSEYFDAQYIYEDQYIDHELLLQIQKIRNNGTKCYIASNQNYYRKEFLLRNLSIKSFFDDHFFSHEIGAVKTESQFWVHLISSIQKECDISPLNMLFLDDMACNLEKAKEFGIRTELISNRNDISKCLEKFLQESI